MGTIEKRPAFAEYWSRLENREARQRAEEIDNAPRGRRGGVTIPRDRIRARSPGTFTDPRPRPRIGKHSGLGRWNATWTHRDCREDMRWTRFERDGVATYGIVEDDLVEAVEGTPFGEHRRTGDRHAVTGHHLAAAGHSTHVLLRGPELCRAHTAWQRRSSVTEPGSSEQAGRRATAPRSALIGHRAPIVLPRDATDRVEYEGELACVVGRTAKHLTRDDALDCLLGFTIGNDVSERSWQVEDRTLWRAKNTDTFKPMGPWIETDLDLEAALTRVRVNGRQVIEFQTNRMIFGVVDYLVEITRYITLHPGDVLWMGTEGHADPIRAGDTVDIEITGIGTLSNPVVADPAGNLPKDSRRVNGAEFRIDPPSSCRRLLCSPITNARIRESGTRGCRHDPRPPLQRS